MHDLNSRWAVNQPNVIGEIIDGEAVIINLDSGTYYSLQDSGAFIWRLLEQNASLQEIYTHLHRQYQGEPSEMEHAIGIFLDDLQREGLIVPSSKDLEAVPEPFIEEGNQSEFRTPYLQKFDDMTDLLLLDPIHEVGEGGWPHTKGQ